MLDVQGLRICWGRKSNWENYWILGIIKRKILNVSFCICLCFCVNVDHGPVVWLSTAVLTVLSTNPGLLLFWFPLNFNNVRSSVLDCNILLWTPACLVCAEPAPLPAQSPWCSSAAAPTAPQHLHLPWKQSRAASVLQELCRLPLGPLWHRS